MGSEALDLFNAGRDLQRALMQQATLQAALKTAHAAQGELVDQLRAREQELKRAHDVCTLQGADQRNWAELKRQVTEALNDALTNLPERATECRALIGRTLKLVAW